MPEHRCLYAVVPHLPGQTCRHRGSKVDRDGVVSCLACGTFYLPDDGGWCDPPPGFPPLDVLNMSYEVRVVAPNEAIDRPGLLILPDRGVVCPPTVDLVVAWNAEHAAHIETVTGLTMGHAYAIEPDHEWVWADDDDGEVGGWDVGVVAARFTVTGCHRIGDGQCRCDTPWALYDYGLFHWTGHAEKVNP